MRDFFEWLWDTVLTFNFLLGLVALAIIGWPFVLAFTALFVSATWFNAILGLVPFVGLAASIVAFPLGYAIISAFGWGRKAIRVLLGIVGTELLFGMYFSIIPITQVRSEIPLLMLSIVTIGVLSGAGIRKPVPWLIAIVVLITVSAFLPNFTHAVTHGRNNAGARTDNWLTAWWDGTLPHHPSPTSSPSAPSSAVPQPRVIAVTAKPNVWSTPIVVPPGWLYDYQNQGPVEVLLHLNTGGIKQYADASGADQVGPNNNVSTISFLSRAAGDVKVVITLTPARP